MSSSIEQPGKAVITLTNLQSVQPSGSCVTDSIYIGIFFTCKEVAIHADYFRSKLCGTFLLVSKSNIVSLFTLFLFIRGLSCPPLHSFMAQKIAADTRQIFGSANRRRRLQIIIKEDLRTGLLICLLRGLKYHLEHP